MDQTKTTLALKQIFDQCGTDVLQDRRRFEAYLEDLLPGSACSTERMVLRHALDSSALTLLLRSPALTADAAGRAVEQLQRESRMNAEDAKFVVRCAIAAQGGDPSVVNRSTSPPRPQPTPQPQPAPAPAPRPAPDPALRKKKIMLRRLASLALLALVAGAYMASRSNGSGGNSTPPIVNMPSTSEADMNPPDSSINPGGEPDIVNDTDVVYPDGSDTYLSLETGNTSGNISNLGLAVEQNGRVFYSDVQDGCMCVLEPDGRAFIMVEQPCYYLNVVGDWIYYCDSADAGNIYRIRTDGTGQELFAMGKYSHLLATGDWVYCVVVLEDVFGYSPQLVRLSTKAGAVPPLEAISLGTLEVLAPCVRTSFVLSDGWIYFIYNGSDEEKGLYGMRENGYDLFMIPGAYASNYAGGVQGQGGWIYYDTYDDDFYDFLCGIWSDGTNFGSVRLDILCGETIESAYDFGLSEYNIYGGNVYAEICDNENLAEGDMSAFSIWKSDSNGSVPQLIGRGIYYPNVVDGYLYFVLYDEENGEFLCRKPLSGGDVELLPVK